MTTMKTTHLIASRLSAPIHGTDWTVLIHTSGAGAVDTRIWLTAEEALELASQLQAAVAQEPATKEAA